MHIIDYITTCICLLAQLSLDERLNAIGIGGPDIPKHPPQADTLATLLAQGLQSQDRKILNVSLHTQIQVKTSCFKNPTCLIIRMYSYLN